jgi:hypothetical protein
MQELPTAVSQRDNHSDSNGGVEQIQQLEQAKKHQSTSSIAASTSKHINQPAQQHQHDMASIPEREAWPVTPEVGEKEEKREEVGGVYLETVALHT